MNVGKLLSAIPRKELISMGQLTAEVKSIVYSSQDVQPGAIFVAVVGFHTDGHKFIDEAIAKGAVAIIGSNRYELNWHIPANYDPAAPSPAIVLVKDERAALAHLAAAFYDYPARKIGVVGITGTKGKTTTSYLVSEVLEAGKYSTGLIGTVDFKVGKRRWANETRQTTPEAVEIQQLMAEMAREKVNYCVLESSSHGLALRKLLDCAYDVALLTNITHEHLDFHGTFDQYRYDKGILFEALSAERPKPFLKFPKTAIINADDPNADYFRERAQEAASRKGIELRVLTYGLRTQADVTATRVKSDASHSEFSVISPLGRVRINLQLPGEFNIYNSLAAITVGISQGVSLNQLKRGLERISGVAGRMQRIDEGQDFAVIVDYAHNPDSIEQVLRTLRPITPGRLTILFGSAGERDIAKRAVQGGLAARLADFAIFTNEDPRLEDENAIIDQIAAGAEAAGWHEGQNFLKIADRRQAIEKAIEQAKPGDTILLAGKGHEGSIIVGTQKVDWNEGAEAQRALRQAGYAKTQPNG